MTFTTNRRRFPRSPVGVAILTALILAAFQLPFSSFMADDFIQIGVLEGVSPFPWAGPLWLYTIADGNGEHMQQLKDSGAYPWFFKQDFKMKFFRPLSAALLYLDYSLFGLNPLGYGVHNILWFIALILILGAILRRVIPGPVGTAALFIFTISGIHAVVLYWAACRHIFVSVTLAVGALLLYIKGREDGWKPGRVLSPILFAAALTAGETAVAVLPYFVAYEFFTGRERTFKQRSTALLPFLAVGIVYLIFYGALGFGASGGSEYLHPLNEPIKFLSALPARLLAMISSFLLVGTGDIWVMAPGLKPFLMMAGVMAVLLFYFLLRGTWNTFSRKEQQSIRWLLIGTAGSFLPLISAAPLTKNMLAPFLGGSVIIAAILYHNRGKKPPLRRVASGILKIGCLFLFLSHLVFSPIQRLFSPAYLKNMMTDRLASTMQTIPPTPSPDDFKSRKVFVLKAPDFIIGLHSYFYRRLYRLPMPEYWRVLSWERCPHRIYRTHSKAFEMELIDGELSRDSFKKGDTFRLTGMEVTIMKVTQNGGASRLRFTFKQPLNEPSFYFLAWREGELKPVELPAVGQTLLL